MSSGTGRRGAVRNTRAAAPALRRPTAPRRLRARKPRAPRFSSARARRAAHRRRSAATRRGGGLERAPARSRRCLEARFVVDQSLSRAAASRSFAPSNDRDRRARTGRVAARMSRQASPVDSVARNRRRPRRAARRDHPQQRHRLDPRVGVGTFEPQFVDDHAACGEGADARSPSDRRTNSSQKIRPFEIEFRARGSPAASASLIAASISSASSALLVDAPSRQPIAQRRRFGFGDAMRGRAREQRLPIALREEQRFARRLPARPATRAR